ncbi:MAG: chorismate synthase [Bacteroidales bacterium]|nr:chorismate synthase [Bacteroidales bacterium]
MNTFGNKFRLTTYGESHGLAVGGIIDGCPAGVKLDIEAITRDLERRRNGAPRQEEDLVEWLSGVTYPSVDQPVTLGTPIAFLIRNKNVRSEDYEALRDAYRPGHADYTYQQKYGLRDHRGGGRASARETVARVVAGAVAKQLLTGITIEAWPEETPATLPDNDTLGGIVKCRITGLPAGIGNPLFGKLNARLAAAMISIPSAIGFEMGAGFAAAKMKGSEYIDRWNSQDFETSRLRDLEAASATCRLEDSSTCCLTKTNHCGGIQGGISNGMPVEFSVAFHPVATLPQPVECLTEAGELRTLTIGGRHDRWHIQRATVVVESMAALVLADYLV